MREVKFVFFVVTLVLTLGISAKESLTDDQIKKIIINESIASYSSVCACPYSIARNGSACGGRSAYSKPGGYSPICYPSDVTDEMIRRYRQRN